MKLFFEKDVKSELLKNEVIAVVGFGPMGRAFALNLRDSGYKVVIGLRETSKNIENAIKENLKVLRIEEAVKYSKVICMLCSDTAMQEVYQIIEKTVKENEKKVLCFAHGFAITYGLIKPKKNFDVILLAPKGTGKAVRENFTNDKGTFALLGIYQNSSGMALNYALELAKALKFLRKGLLKTTFENETITDIFGEQTVLCGG
ncbi:MAG: NAD(P)-binding domain-containing protein, partial [Candidatus Anstonellales archaeon]